jgi:hypothetical protein
VILPDEMKDILNRVVEAEKAAQGKLIKRKFDRRPGLITGIVRALPDSEFCHGQQRA